MKTEVSSLEYDSRETGPNSIFFAIEGHDLDGHQFIPQALFKGAAAIISEREAPPDFSGTWLQVETIRRYMAEMAGHFFGHPSERLQLVGVTGTNGKTTTASLIHSVLSRAGPAALLGTVETIVGNDVMESIRTTPEAAEIQKLLARALEQECRAGVVEVSSHALALDRVYGCRFEVGVFTNLTRDHLDFHDTFENYLASKRRLFDLSYTPALRVAILNGDDASVAACPLNASVRAVTFGMSDRHDVYPLSVNTGLDGTDVLLSVEGRQVRLSTSLAGDHNVYNLMAAVSACSHLGFPDHQIAAGVRALERVRGRFEKVPLDAPFTVFVDYAHTPDALASALGLARGLSRGRVISVFGCGGDRDRTKRPQMGRIASELADILVLTSDNPRSESPREIIRQIELGIGPDVSFESVTDRREAISHAFQLAGPGDIVLITGKGHERYQEAAGGKIEFNDAQVAAEIYDHSLSR